MVQHTVDDEKCRGCGKCEDICSLELWEMAEADGGTKRAVVVEEAGEICNSCLCCSDACPEDAITITEE